MHEYAAEIDLVNADDASLEEISKKNLLALTTEEMREVQRYFSEMGRNPTDCELETIAQTWSEHCCHKLFRAEIEYSETTGGKTEKKTLKLLQEIKSVTEKLAGEFCVSVFKDNAGIIRFNENYGIAFKAETHNHPSALEPYGGAGTGVGGVIRDVLGAGKGAEPLMNIDVLCFGMTDVDYNDLPEGVLHPRRVFRGVVSGIRDYGNRMGIPTAAGAVVFHKGYQNNCLVFCGTLGIIPLADVEKEVQDNDLIVLIGGRTGRDGIHGATFSSIPLDAQMPTSVVQIGNPIVQKKMADALIQAREKGLYNCITDCGAGGLSSAVGEMGGETGAEVMLDRVPLKEQGLAPWEIWVSESQERMVLSVPEKHIGELTAIFNSEDVEASVIGSFTQTGLLELSYNGESICSMHMDFLHNGIPLQKTAACFKEKLKETATRGPETGREELQKRILKVMGSPNIASREPVINQYDHEVQGRTVLKPLTGMKKRGHSDAVVIKPLYDNCRGVAVACGINPFYGMSDPYAMAGCCIEEALRNIVASGGNPEKTAILDNFCWGDTSESEKLGTLVRCVKGCKDFALQYKLPFISGKDSLNNFFLHKKTGITQSIPGTLLISAAGIVPDIRKTVSSGLKAGGNILYLCGRTRKEMGGSEYYRLFGIKGGKTPVPEPETALPLMKKLHACMQKEKIRACHDCSEGGFITALLEMAVGGGKGADISFDSLPDKELDTETLLFSETQGRFIAEVSCKDEEEFQQMMSGSAVFPIGRVKDQGQVTVSRTGEYPLSIDVGQAEKSWKEGLKC